jgi:RecB family exonuclease
MVSDHYRAFFLKDRRKSLGIEDSFEVALGDGSRYTGVIDRLALDPDKTLHVIDYKTTSRPPTVHGEAQRLQIRSYGMGSLMLRGGRKVRLSYQYLRNGAEFTETLDRSSAERTAGALVERIGSVQRATHYPARPSALCGWCGYREECSDSGYAHRADSTDRGRGSGCPRCGGRLRERQGRFGAFLGCGNYPECRYTRNPD